MTFKKVVGVNIFQCKNSHTFEMFGCKTYSMEDTSDYKKYVLR
jgi:hypothetical protein